MTFPGGHGPFIVQCETMEFVIIKSNIPHFGF